MGFRSSYAKNSAKLRRFQSTAGMAAARTAPPGGYLGLRSDLVSWWEHGEATDVARADSLGVNNMAVVVSVTQDVGVSGSCSRTGAGSYLKKVSPASAGFTSGDFTLAAWFKGTVTNQGLVCRWRVGSNQRIYCLIVEGGVGKFIVSTDGVGATSATSGSSLNNGAWHLLIGYRSTTDGKIYMQVDNGTPVGTTFSAASALYSAASPDLTLMSLDQDATYASGAYQDSTGMWARELTSAERTSLWNGGAGLGFAAL